MECITAQCAHPEVDSHFSVAINNEQWLLCCSQCTCLYSHWYYHGMWPKVISQYSRDDYSSHDPGIKVGDLVRVRPSVIEPTHGFGSRVNHSSIGIVRSVNPPDLSIDFPNHKDWAGVMNEMEVVRITTSTTTTTTTTTTDRTSTTSTISMNFLPAS